MVKRKNEPGSRRDYTSRILDRKVPRKFYLRREACMKLKLKKKMHLSVSSRIMKTARRLYVEKRSAHIIQLLTYFVKYY